MNNFQPSILDIFQMIFQCLLITNTSFQGKITIDNLDTLIKILYSLLEVLLI